MVVDVEDELEWPVDDGPLLDDGFDGACDGDLVVDAADLLASAGEAGLSELAMLRGVRDAAPGPWLVLALSH